MSFICSLWWLCHNHNTIWNVHRKIFNLLKKLVIIPILKVWTLTGWNCYWLQHWSLDILNFHYLGFSQHNDSLSCVNQDVIILTSLTLQGCPLRGFPHTQEDTRINRSSYATQDLFPLINKHAPSGPHC